ncbi:HAD-IA family hydrolase [Aliterella atlantica]|uniref:Hydrolase n=1 Tax=Aliterella atlantica CENA595 TaxID=1618023 RepID=A0A0D8ZTX1_9CYAN|nr:HAD family hydrolase [Aliterella atlantica]KJH70681.1 hydrolase [Aliterella atlantica CENA595]
MKQPKVIFLDAVGTLFYIKGSVGVVYADIARQFGVEVAGEAVNAAFFQSFVAAPPPMFPGVKLEDIPDYEYEWWQSVALDTFNRVGVLEKFADFATFFDSLYSHFATAKPWFIYADVIPTLEYWQRRGIELGIISNFDSRLYLVLAALGLENFFSSITISTEAGAAKPESQIFTTALSKHNCLPEKAWHIGDSFKEDYQGATKSGLTAILLKRSE